MATRSSGAKRKTTGYSSKKGKSSQKNNGVIDEVLIVLVFAVSVLLLFSTFGLLGKIGKGIGSVLFGLFGLVAYLFPFFFAFAMFFTVVNKGKRVTKIKIGSAILFLLMLCCLAHLIFGRNINLNAGQNITYFYKIQSETHATGGFLGGAITHFLKKFLGTFGAVIVVIAFSIISGVLFTEKSLFSSVKRGSANLVEDARRMKEYRSRQAEVIEMEREERNERARLRNEEREIARKKRLAEQDEKREARLQMRRERAEKARIEREENAQKAREEARALYLKQQAEEQLRKKQEEEAKARADYENDIESADDLKFSDVGDVYSQQNIGNEVSIEESDETLTTSTLEDEKIPTKVVNPYAGMPSPEIMTFGPRDDSSKRRIDNKVSGVMPHTMLFDLHETNGEIREITPAYEGEVINFEDKVFHKEHRINVSDTDSGIDSIYKEAEPAKVAGMSSIVKESGYELPFVEKTVKRDDSIEQVKEAFFVDENIDEETEIPEPIHDKVSTDYSKPEPVMAKSSDAGSSLTASSQTTLKPVAVKKDDSKSTVVNSVKTDKSYKLPPLSLLNEVKAANGNNANDELRETGNKLKEILKTFGVNVTISGASRGPSVTRYEIQPEIGTKVSKVVSLTDDIKMALAATDIRMEAPIPGKSAIGIEVPNKENTAVQYRELVESRTFKDAKSKISFAVGKDLNGQVIVTDIDKLPHVLIAGATGSGKSVCINTLIMSILYKATPEDVRLIMIDPKVVELSVYNDIPHLLLPVVTDPKKASVSLQWAVNEMMRRYQCFEELQVRNMEGYNSIISENPEYTESGKHQKMPQIVIIVDELADLMMVASKEVEESICRLAQLARAAGIHLVLATQRPSVNVVTGLIKANMPSRIAFAVSSGIDSRTILDMVGAEKLLGKGDMLFYPQNYTKPARIQGAFVSDDEVRRVVEFWKSQCDGSPYDESAKSHVENGSSSGSNSGGFSAPEQDNGFDPLFYEAGRSIIEKQKASIGMLQRIHKIGFNRAARIMDQLSDAGVVGPDEGTKARSILMTIEEFEEFIKENNK